MNNEYHTIFANISKISIFQLRHYCQFICLKMLCPSPKLPVWTANYVQLCIIMPEMQYCSIQVFTKISCQFSVIVNNTKEWNKHTFYKKFGCVIDQFLIMT